MDRQKWYPLIPKVDYLLEKEPIKTALETYGRQEVVEAIRVKLDALRMLFSMENNEKTCEKALSSLEEEIVGYLGTVHEPTMKRVLNGTGTILHTNLGRAPISSAQKEQLMDVIFGYSNLEYDLPEGVRGERYSHFEKVLCKITGAEAALAVNNNAASVMLLVSALAAGGEVITSRGELVEIGGKFRIPDVMEQSGARLREVGTTNKTHIEDYENAINEETKMLMKVHTSNFQVIGFTQTVKIGDIVEIAHRYGLPAVEDLGSGVLINLEKYGLPHEPTIQESLAAGADVVCFSGDKLLGGPQAGIIVGKKQYIDKIKKHPLTRAVRIDKFTAAALELVFMEYLSEEMAMKNIPVLRMIGMEQKELHRLAEALVKLLEQREFPIDIQLVQCQSQIGGGALPSAVLDSYGVQIKPQKVSVFEVVRRMRQLPLPVIPKVADDSIYLDVRTLDRTAYKRMTEEFEREQIFEA